MTHMGHDHASMGHSMMHMTFYSGKEVTLWLDSLTSSTWSGYCGLVALVIGLGLMHEGLHAFRLACSKAPARRMQQCVAACFDLRLQLPHATVCRHSFDPALQAACELCWAGKAPMRYHGKLHRACALFMRSNMQHTSPPGHIGTHRLDGITTKVMHIQIF